MNTADAAFSGGGLAAPVTIVIYRENAQKEDHMKLQKILLVLSVVFLLSSASVVTANDFDWMDNLNITAHADITAFRANLSARFNIGDTQVKAVISNVEKPADAYMVLRLGEMSSKPTNVVIERYRTEKGKGWGVIAKSLGIKPGSKEFHDLKRGHDLGNYKESAKSDSKDTGKGNGNGKGKGKGKGKS